MLKYSVILSRFSLFSRFGAYTHVFPTLTVALTAPVRAQPSPANSRFLTLGSPHSSPPDKPPIHTHTPTEKEKQKEKRKERKRKRKGREAITMSSGGRRVPWRSSSAPSAKQAGAQKRKANEGVSGVRGPLSSHAIGSSQNPISLTTPSPTNSDAEQTPASIASSSSKRRRLTSKAQIAVPPPPIGLHATGLCASDFASPYFDLDDLENDNAAALEIVDLTQSDESQDMPFMGSTLVKVVGVRHYDGYATPGEQVLLKRERHNPVRFLLYSIDFRVENMILSSMIRMPFRF